MSNSKNNSGLNILAGLLFLILAGYSAWNAYQLGFLNFGIRENWMSFVWYGIWAGLGILLLFGRMNAGLIILPMIGAALMGINYANSMRLVYLAFTGAYVMLAVLAVMAAAKNSAAGVFWFLPTVFYAAVFVFSGISFKIYIEMWMTGRNLGMLFEPLALFFTGLWLLTQSIKEKEEGRIRYDSADRMSSGMYGPSSGRRSGFEPSGTGTTVSGGASRSMTEAERERQKQSYRRLLEADVITRSEYDEKIRKLDRH